MSLDAEAWVGRIMRARKLSSTWLSLLGRECSWVFLGGGPTLGLSPLIVEGCLLIVLVVEVPIVDTLALLEERVTPLEACR